MARRPAGECAIRKRADGRWMAQLTIKLSDGNKKRITIINQDRDIVKAKLLENQDQQRKMIPFSPKNWTVGDYLDHWLKNIMPHKISPGTMDGYERTIRLYIKPTIGHKKLNALGVRDVTDALDVLERKEVTSRNRQKFKQALSSCLTYAMREELVFRNVAMIAKMPAHHSKIFTPWNASQAWYFLTQTKDDEHYIKYLAFLIYGPRAGEVFGLRWTDIDFHNDNIVIRQQITNVRGKLLLQTVKTDASRRPLPLIPLMKQALLEYAQKCNIIIPPFDPNRELTTDGLIFTTRLGTPVDYNNFRKRHFYKMTDKYGLPRIRLHDTRHTAATLLKDMGMPVKDVQEILGHADIATTLKIYQHGNEHIKRRGLTMLSEGLTGMGPSGYSSAETVAESEYNYCSQNLQSNTDYLPSVENPSLLSTAKSPFWPRAYESPESYPPVFAASVISRSKHEQTHTNAS